MALANAVDRGEGEPADSDSCSEGDGVYVGGWGLYTYFIIISYVYNTDDLDPLLTSLTLSQTQQKRLKVRRKSSVANQGRSIPNNYSLMYLDSTYT